MRILLAVAALALAAACSREPELPAPEGAAAAADAGAGAAQKRMPLPDCSEVETQDAGADGWLHPDCRLMLGDDSKLALEARYSSAEDNSTIVSVQIVLPGDATSQTIEETMGNTFESLKLEDIDRDGRMDIWVPLETGNVNTTWAVWRQGADAKFVRLGELFGVDLEYTDGGLIATPSRSGAAEWAVAYYKPGPTEFVHQATVIVTAEGKDDGTILSWACKLWPEAGLGQGLTAADAEAKFCAEHAASGIFQ